MANLKQIVARRPKMAERAKMTQEIIFPNYAPAWLWHRKTHNGFCSLPRTLPIAMQAIDAQSKGQPAGHTLFCLWARSPDQPVITIENQAIFAAEAGFQGARAVDTWRRRMKKLKELWFIDTRPGALGDFHYVLLLNPNAAMESLRRRNLIQDELYTRFKDRLCDIGAYGDLEAINLLWAQNDLADMAKQQAAEEAQASQKSEDPPKAENKEE